MPGFCCPFGLFHRFCGALRCMSQLSIDGVKAGQSCFERPGPRGRFLAEIRIPCSIFPSNARKDSPFVPFYRRLEKTFLLSAPIRTIFLSLELSTFVRTLCPSFPLRHSLKINISNRSCVAWRFKPLRASVQSGEAARNRLPGLPAFLLPPLLHMLTTRLQVSFYPMRCLLDGGEAQSCGERNRENCRR